MTTTTQEMQAREKREAPAGSEQTTPGRVFVPNVDIFENDHALTIVADMPGVQSETVTVDLRDNVLTLTGVPAYAIPQQEEILLQEYEIGKFFRQFTLSEVIDQEHIKAQLTNGVLKVILPKIGPAQPRKVPITGGEG